MAGAAPPMGPEYARLVSRYGIRRGRTTGQLRMHAGIDLASTRRNEPVHAIRGGTVDMVAENRPGSPMDGYGNAVVVKHDDGTYALYAHLASVTVRQGQRIDAGKQLGVMGNTTNGKFSPLPDQTRAQWMEQMRARGIERPVVMTPHLHIELRRERPGGRSPFPGPYPQTPQQALYNMDPVPWLSAAGVRFGRRGVVEIVPGSEAAMAQPTWAALIGQSARAGGLGGLAYALHDLGQAIPADAETGEYEPVEFERDVRFGLSPMEWAAAGAGAMIFTATTAAFILRRRRAVVNRRRRTTRA